MSNCKCVFHIDTKLTWIYTISELGEDYSCRRYACPDCDKVLIRSLA
jgi:hypothetical protein